MDIPRIFNITESAHRIHNPFTPDKYATLGAALRLSAGARVLDLGSGSGEMLCTWARDHGIVGTGIDMSPLFTAQAQSRAVELGVAAQVSFIHGDAAGHVADEKVDVAACIGATWIGGGVAGTIALLAQSLRPGGIILFTASSSCLRQRFRGRAFAPGAAASGPCRSVSSGRFPTSVPSIGWCSADGQTRPD